MRASLVSFVFRARILFISVSFACLVQVCMSCAGLQQRASGLLVIPLILSSMRYENDGWLQL